MSILEFGAEKGPKNPEIPKRPIFQIVAFTGSPQYNPKVSRSIRNWSKTLASKDNSRDLLNAIGKIYQQELVSLFGDTSLLDDNSPTTVRLKGRNDPLEDSGDLKGNLAYRNSKDKEIMK